MIWDVLWTIVCIVLVIFAGSALIYLLKERQDSDRSYGGENDTAKWG
jgi:hypothetical protein